MTFQETLHSGGFTLLTWHGHVDSSFLFFFLKNTTFAFVPGHLNIFSALLTNLLLQTAYDQVTCQLSEDLVTGQEQMTSGDFFLFSPSHQSVDIFKSTKCTLLI